MRAYGRYIKNSGPSHKGRGSHGRVSGEDDVVRVHGTEMILHGLGRGEWTTRMDC